MATLLDGGCIVMGLREGEPSRHGTLSVWSHVGRATGARAISLRVMELSPGLSPGLSNRACDEVLYVLEGRATVTFDSRPYDVGAETGIYLAPGVSFAVDVAGPEPLVLVSSRCPDPGEPVTMNETAEPAAMEAPIMQPASARPRGAAPSPAPIVRLADREALPVRDRWYRTLVDGEVRSTRVTQFVGSIPPGRAPDHYHHYEEVLCILRGRGILWAGAMSAPIGPGSCIFLPQRQVHCIQNTGEDELRLLGVFYPAGSPAVAYTPDSAG